MDIETCRCRYAGTYARKSFDLVTCHFPDHPISNTLSPRVLLLKVCTVDSTQHYIWSRG
jgi:hypothetical protein